MLLVILCVTFLPFAFASIETTCLPPDEVDVLKNIGSKLGKYDWDFTRDPCLGWEVSFENNVTCNVEPNNTICHVVSISLIGQNLSGTLPQEFVNLTYLQNLALTRNYLNGTIPPQWGSMKQIITISLLANRLTGSIPKDLGNINTLRYLSVEDNRMSGAIPAELGNLTSIKRLFLSSNFFTGELPASFANLINMKDFRIGSNNFSGKIPDFIGKWTGLAILRISDLRGPDTPCPPFKDAIYKILILRSCNLIGELPKSLVSTDLLSLGTWLHV